MTNLEEASTVAETTSRTRGPTTNLGYYTFLGGKPRELYDQDREMMTHGKPLRGKRAVDNFSENFEDTNISNLQYKRNGRKARSSVEKGREEGKYPPRKNVSEKPVSTASRKKASASGKASKTKASSKSVSKGTKASKPRSSSAKSSSKGKTGGRR